MNSILLHPANWVLPKDSKDYVRLKDLLGKTVEIWTGFDYQEISVSSFEEKVIVSTYLFFTESFPVEYEREHLIRPVFTTPDKKFLQNVGICEYQYKTHEEWLKDSSDFVANISLPYKLYPEDNLYAVSLPVDKKLIKEEILDPYLDDFYCVETSADFLCLNHILVNVKEFNIDTNKYLDKYNKK